jgi:DNA sulfur modification protein DndD
MILFKRAHFENFRMLRDVDLEFSIDPKQPLTVIRGENGSGKTTVLWALQWAFWGDEILPNEGRDFRLHPVDWDRSAGPCPISVQITFETEADEEGATGLPRSYTVNRQCVEDIGPDDRFQRHSHVLNLYELTDKGTPPMSHPELFLAAILPKELREVFFTDGARVLSFTGADLSQTTKRKRVQDAIRALLGIDLLEDARDHVKWVQSEINAQLKETSADKFLTDLASNIEREEKELESQTKLRDGATEQVAQFEVLYLETSAQLEASLTKGDRDTLAKELGQAEADTKRYREQISECLKMRSDLFKEDSLAAGLLYKQMTAAREKLRLLEQAKQIPRNYFPVLQQRLEIGKCICGEDLVPGDTHYEHVVKLMEEQSNADDASSRLTYLVSTAAKFTSAERTGYEWLAQLTKFWRMQTSAEVGWRDAEARRRAVDQAIAGLPDTDLNQLRTHKADLLQQKERAIEKRAAAETAIDRLNKTLTDHREQRKNWMKLRDRYRKQQAQLEASQDLVGVLEQAFGTIQDTKIGEVSQKMNALFLEMIGAEQDGGIIQRAEISKDFDIKVYGPQGKHLDPDRDLNGASRRALTLAFILAVTSVSGVTAPSVIDTPISELSGPVRTEALRLISSLSQQLILFLTRADITGVEDVIDHYAGVVETISNSTHFPKFLVNDPHRTVASMLVCNCSHRQYCAVCERVGDALDPELKRRVDTVGATA